MWFELNPVCLLALQGVVAEGVTLVEVTWEEVEGTWEVVEEASTAAEAESTLARPRGASATPASTTLSSHTTQTTSTTISTITTTTTTTSTTAATLEAHGGLEAPPTSTTAMVVGTQVGAFAVSNAGESTHSTPAAAPGCHQHAGCALPAAAVLQVSTSSNTVTRGTTGGAHLWAVSARLTTTTSLAASCWHPQQQLVLMGQQSRALRQSRALLPSTCRLTPGAASACALSPTGGAPAGRASPAGRQPGLTGSRCSPRRSDGGVRCFERERVSWSATIDAAWRNAGALLRPAPGLLWEYIRCHCVHLCAHCLRILLPC